MKLGDVGVDRYGSYGRMPDNPLASLLKFFSKEPRYDRLNLTEENQNAAGIMALASAGERRPRPPGMQPGSATSA